ncbi:MAG: GMC family oxidoreductase [Burkholderiaceae bacterium]|nr:GMC family oxidoreductase [Burkholderiaceae bacterium]
MTATLPEQLSVIEASGHHWDWVVVGTGPGGATFGHALARKGHSVLFVERGFATHGNSLRIASRYPEEDSRFTADPSARADLLRRSGRWSEILHDQSTAKPRPFTPFIGSGTGGSSALYGMVMERFFPSDFEGDGLARARWPFDYDELLPYYIAAERLYGVQGERDPLRQESVAQDSPSDSPTLNREHRWLREHLDAQGLHPYRVPVACALLSQCEGCQGVLCPHPCKRDAASQCLMPALRDHGARLLTGCTVQRLHANGPEVRAVELVDSQGLSHQLLCRNVALAAGALVTPHILMRSASEQAPSGLANRSGLVGRNLMRHAIDLYAVPLPPQACPPDDLRQKQLAFNDWYDRDGVKLGSVQSFGKLPPGTVVATDLRNSAQAALGHWVGSVLQPMEGLLAKIVDRQFEQRLLLAATLEDTAQASNRVLPACNGDDRLRIHYRLPPGDLPRLQIMRSRMRKALAPHGVSLLKQAENNQRIAHACGTARAGLSPATSVLTAHCRTHDVGNLWVIDGSFFPSSGGTNPSLTIAANALRVAASL